MIVLDTHAWLWWVSEPRKLSRRAREAIEMADWIGICTISCYEVAGLAARGRITVDRQVGDWVVAALARDRVETLPLSATIAVAAALLDRRTFTGDQVDRIVYATARAARARLVTKDDRLLKFDVDATVW